MKIRIQLMYKKTLFSVIASIALLIAFDAACQEPTDSISIPIVILPDTIDFTQDIPDTERTEIILISDPDIVEEYFPVADLESYIKHSPAKAAMMSAVVPGLGQIYNRRYWKLPIVYAAIGVSVGFFVFWQNEFSCYRRAYVDMNDNDPYTNYHLSSKFNFFPDFYTETQRNQYITKRKDQYRTNRDWSIVAMAAAYALNIIDANVDAHLMDFSLDDNISLKIRPNIIEHGNSQKFGLVLSLNF